MHRAWWIVALSGTLGCAGGQTGEITGLTACREPAGEVAVDEASPAGRSAQEQLAELTTSVEAQLRWEAERAPSALSVSLALTGEPATLWGGAGCSRPYLEAPVTVTLRTADGLLDETMEGSVTLSDTELAAVQATIPIEEMNRALDGASPGAIVRVDLLSERDAATGQLWLRPEGADDTLLASF